jgi:glycine/D-amino acid oxidase-like deaminating enzyme
VLDADYIIVGAGLAGAATAYHLRRLGETRVAVLERELAPGSHSSGRNAALVRARVEDEAIQPVVAEGARFIAESDAAPFRRTGSLLLGFDNDEPLTEVAPLFPPARGSGLFTPDDGVVDVASLLYFYLRDVDLRPRTEVRDWRSTAGGVEVETSRGRFTARVLVNAAGAWAGPLGALRLRPLLRHLFVTTTSDNIAPDWPFIWDVENGLYFRSESGGLLLCPCDETETAPGDYTERWSAFEMLAEKIDRLQPGLREATGDLTIAHRWAGQRTFATDNRFVIGYDNRTPALFWVAGLGGHGVTSSFAVGRIAAEALIAGPAASQSFAPGRLLAASAAGPLGAVSR